VIDPIESAKPLVPRFEVNDVAIPRLFAYHRALAGALAAGKTVITSFGIAALLGHTISSTQIRKDLSALGPLGRRGQGYAIKPLVDQLSLVLGLQRDWRIAIVGFGYLGHAFATFVAAREEHFKVAAIFDRSQDVIGQMWQDTPVHDVSRLEAVLSNADCNIGVIAVPAREAQGVAERLAALGIRALLNFAPASLHLREPVMVRNIDLAGELSILTHGLTFSERSAMGYTI
jgi:redox-sensing transcriptional repressor